MNTEWIKILTSAVVGFVVACIVQGVSVWWQERTGRARLRESLYREIALIYVEVRNLLTSLELEGRSNDRSPSEVNFQEFVKADCFEAAKASPVFWRIADALGIIKAHRNFQYLAVVAPSKNAKSEKIRLEQF